MVNAKDLRDMFEEIRSEAGKRAAHVINDAKMPDMSRMPELRRHDDTPGIVWLGLGLVLGAVVGMAIALIAAPYPGQETRKRLGQQVDKMKRQGEDQIEQIKTAKSGSGNNGGTPTYKTPTDKTPTYTTPTSVHERS